VRLAQRVWVLLTVPVVLCLTIYGVVGARFHRAELIAEAENEVRETATALGTAMSLLPPDIESAELHAFAERLTRDTRVLGIGIYDPQGQWLGGSRVASTAHGALGDLVSDALRRRRDHQETRVVAGHACLARVELITPGAGSPAGAVLVLRDLEYVRDALRRSRDQLIVVALVMALVMAAAAWRIARWLTEPGRVRNTEAVRVGLWQLCGSGHRVALSVRRADGEHAFVHQEDACAVDALSAPHLWVPVRLYAPDEPVRARR